MSGASKDDFEVVVGPGFAPALVFLVLAFTAVHAYAGRLSGQAESFVASLNWAAGVVVLVLLGMTLHELGHVLAATAVGHRWTKMVLNGAGLEVVLEPHPHGWHRITQSLAGPLVQILVALPMLATLSLKAPAGYVIAGADPHSMWWVAGASNLVLAVVSLLPVRTWDGGKVLAGVDELIAGRRS